MSSSHTTHFTKLGFWFDWIKPLILTALAFLLFWGLALGYVWSSMREHLYFFSVALAVPTMVALLTIGWHLYRSGYVRIATELGSRRDQQKAALALVQTTCQHVLLNRQTQPPWQDMWILPGGYVDKLKDNGIAALAAGRRLTEIAQPTCDLVAQQEIATTNGTPSYINTILEHGHTPTHDVVFRVFTTSRRLPERRHVVESDYVKWVKADDISNGRFAVPPHMKELILYFLNAESKLRFWHLRADSALDLEGFLPTGRPNSTPNPDTNAS